VYHPEVIDHFRNKLEGALNIQLREYSFTEVSDFKFRMRNIPWEAGSPGQLIAAQSEDIQRYVFNEIQMSKVSFEYWCSRYAHVIDDKGSLVPIVPWPTQRALLNMVAEEELESFKYWREAPDKRELESKSAIILLKARQLGGTVISEALLAHLVFFFRYTRAGIASDHMQNSLKLWQTFMRMYENLPPWMKPSFEGKMKAHNLHLDAMDSDVVVGAGNMDTTFGQGMTVDTAHLTELSTWLTRNADALDEDLKPAFYSSRKHHSLLIFESTGQGGKGNYFHDQYIAASKGKSRFKSLFLGWFFDPYKWAIRADGVIISEQTQDVAKMILKTANITCSREQLAWYEVTRADYEERGKLQQFLQEYPSTPEEAFQTGFNSVFPLELRTKLRSECGEPLGVYRFEHESHKFKGQQLSSWIADKSPDKADNLLLLYEKPRQGCTYVLGVDVSYDSEGGDSSAIEVLRVGTKYEEDEQVAEWRGTISPVSLADLVEVLGKMYAARPDDFPAKVAVEVNPGSPGIVTQTELIRRGYPHFYVWKRPLKTQKAWTQEVGWHTTTGTRVMLTEKGSDAIITGTVKINSPFLVGEMDSFINNRKNTGYVKMEHAPNCHDDRLMALFMAFVVGHELETSYTAEDRAAAWAEKLNVKEEKHVEWNTLGITYEEAMKKWEESVLG